MDSNDIGKKDQYQKRLFDRLIEGRRENQIMEMRLPLPDSSSTSRVSDNSREKDRQIVQLTHQLRESEESRQEVSQRLEHVRRETQRDRNQQQRDIQEKDRQIRLRNDAIQLVQESSCETISRLQRNSQDSQQAMEALRDTNEQLQRENRELCSYIETPHWVIKREELQMTRQEIGGGAYGKVNIAIFRGTKVAAKSLHEVIISEYNLGVFTREMEISSRIHHPNIVQFLGATRVNNPILLYELMTTSLYKKIQEARLTQPQIVDVSSDITSALAYLHLWKPHPIIHRDVSSPNVLMEPSGNDRWRSKLSDFGSANLQSRVKTEIPGNPAYASPEAGIPDNHTPAMDIYSLGVVIMEMILHQPPEMTTISRERQAQSIQWRPMKALVLRCINNDRTQRPKTAQILDALKVEVKGIQSILATKEEKMKELETQLREKNKILQNGKWIK